MQQCREAAKRKKTPRTVLVQGSGEVNGQSFRMLCQSNSVQALSTTDQPVFRNNYARRCKPWFFKMQSTNSRIHPGSSSHEDSHEFRPHYNEQVKNDDPVPDQKLINRLGPMAASKHHSDLTLMPYSMATFGMFFAKTNKPQRAKYLIKDADHA